MVRDLIPDTRRLVIPGVEGIHADPGERYAGPVVDPAADMAGHPVDLHGRGIVRDLNVHRTIIAVRPVVVQREIVSAFHALFHADQLFDFSSQFRVRAPAEDLADRVADHPDAGTNDENRDHRAEIRLKRHPGKHTQHGAEEHGGREHRVGERVGSGGLQ